VREAAAFINRLPESERVYLVEMIYRVAGACPPPGRESPSGDRPLEARWPRTARALRALENPAPKARAPASVGNVIQFPGPRQ